MNNPRNYGRRQEDQAQFNPSRSNLDDRYNQDPQNIRRSASEQRYAHGDFGDDQDYGRSSSSSRSQQGYPRDFGYSVGRSGRSAEDYGRYSSAYDQSLRSDPSQLRLDQSQISQSPLRQASDWSRSSQQDSYSSGLQGIDQSNPFDPDYHQWRSEQVRNLDSDYQSWRKERYRKFADEFNQWRNSRSQHSDSDSLNAGSSSGLSSSGSSGLSGSSSAGGSGISGDGSSGSSAGSASGSSGSSSGSSARNK